MKFFVVIVGVVILAACAPLPTASSTPTGATITTADGFRITPQTVAADDVADILAIRRWNFKVELPEPNVPISYIVEVQRPDQAPVPLLRIESGANPNRPATYDVLVATYPVNESVTGADQLQVFVRTDSGSSSIVSPNPFKGMNASSTKPFGEARDDGGFNLIEVSPTNQTPDPQSARLVFNIQRGDEQ